MNGFALRVEHAWLQRHVNFGLRNSSSKEIVDSAALRCFNQRHVLTFRQPFFFQFLERTEIPEGELESICKTCQVVRLHLGWIRMSELCSAICLSARSV